MKYEIAFLILLLGSAWTYDVQNADAAEGRVWIFFKDRPYIKYKSLHPAQVTSFSSAAIKRRETRALAPWDESDFPVDPAYVLQVKNLGATVFVESRWLNAVSASCDEQCRSAVQSLPYVLRVRPVVTYRRENEIIIPEKETTGFDELQPSGASRLSYGSSREQLIQIRVPAAHNRGFAGQGEIVAIFDTGFRKDHVAFKKKTVVAERDFVFGDNNVTNGGNADSHGTSTWSCVGGEVVGKLYGPAYKASFILAATEDIRSETKVEEDNWVAAFEWADQLGATVVSSSLGYFDWYDPSDFNGTTAVTSRVASKAAQKGIVVVNSAGNSGPAAGTLGAPADAKDILTVGAVDERGLIANFSSRGPTADGRTKPEVCARGVLTYVAMSTATNTFGRSNGTSFSCPLIAGSAAVLLSARPDWNPFQIREAFIKTASRSTSPGNIYGWGILNLTKALNYLPSNSIVIEHEPLKNTSNTTQPYAVVARIRAERSLDTNELYVYWKTEGSSTFQRIRMTAVSNTPDKYRGQIQAQPNGTTVEYYISAKDSKGKIGSTPVNAPADTYQFKVQ